MAPQSEKPVAVDFEPWGRSVPVLPGVTLLEAAALAGLTLDTPCGGGGTCGKCRVQIRRGAGPPTQAENRIFDGPELAAGWRLACQTVIHGPMAVHIPAGSLFATQYQIQERSETGRVGDIEPAVRKVYVELPLPSLDEDAPDLMRLESRLGPFSADAAVLRALPRQLREGGFRGTAVLADARLIDLEPGDTTGRCHAAAFDVGTTTLVGSLLDLRSGAEVAVASSLNPQVAIGDDVLSRIRHAGRPQGLAELHEAVIGEINRLLGRLCEAAGIERQGVYEVALAGNTTMEHLACGIDPSALGQLPFVPAYGRGLLFEAARIGLEVHPRALAYVFPVIGGFVGGDTVAGMLVTRLATGESPALMVDVGTNGEIVLSHDGQLRAASTAAGPAFEGARISCGMRACQGAVQRVVFDDDVRISVIGEGEPAGLCGSGLIDLAAEMIRLGLVTSSGRLLGPDALPADIPPNIRRRVRTNGAGQVTFVFARRGDGAALQVTRKDFRELQLAAGAIRTGIRILLRQSGLRPADLKQVLLAGGFGSFIRRRNARQIGLLPPELDDGRIHYVGNTSLGGARWAVLSAPARREAEDLARRTRHIELSRDADFHQEFAESMMFPAPLAP